jgi:iron complex transport system ATP-binding protein
LIRLENASASYGQRTALEPVSLSVVEGETLVLVGPNSAGKSTLLKLMGGLLHPSTGSIQLMGRPLSAWPLNERARRVAWVPSETDFTFAYRVEDMVLLGRTPYVLSQQKPTERDRAIVQEMLELTDLVALADRSVAALSSGERQRVLLARALAQEPAILLLDEPTAHLDLGHSQAFFRALARLRETRSLTVVLATHDLELARTIGGRIALLKEGRLFGLGVPAKILTPEAIQTIFQNH